MKKQKIFEHKNLLIVALVALVAGLGFYWYSVNSEPDIGPLNIKTTGQNNSGMLNNNKQTNTAPAGDTTQLKGKNILNIGPQKPGTSLIVDLVNLVKPGFIAVYQADSKGKAGTLITTSPLLKAGTSQDLVVKATLKGNTTYIISLHNDDGDGKFNAAKDVVLNDASGKPVVLNITTSAK